MRLRTLKYSGPQSHQWENTFRPPYRLDQHEQVWRRTAVAQAPEVWQDDQGNGDHCDHRSHSVRSNSHLRRLRHLQLPHLELRCVTCTTSSGSWSTSWTCCSSTTTQKGVSMKSWHIFAGTTVVLKIVDLLRAYRQKRSNWSTCAGGRELQGNLTVHGRQPCSLPYLLCLSIYPYNSVLCT